MNREGGRWVCAGSNNLQRAMGQREGRCGSILLECVLALALFIAVGMAVLAMTSRAAGSLEAVRDAQIAADIACSTMAQLEAGIATAETLHGPVPAWRDERDGAFDDSLQVETGWRVEIETQPSEFDGLTSVRVRAFRHPPGEPERQLGGYTLHQLVRLSSEGPGSRASIAHGGAR